MTSTKLNTLAVSGMTLSKDCIQRLEKAFQTVHYHPDEKVPQEEWKNIEVWYTTWTGLPKDIKSLDDVPKTKALQLSSAGGNMALSGSVFQTQEGKERIKVLSASGIHALSIPQWVMAQIVNLYMDIHIQTFMARKDAKWPAKAEIPRAMKSHSMYGKTAGMLGYGHIGRETARVLRAMNAKVIAANSSGSKRRDEGYVFPGTGDVEGSIPEAYYSTNDPESFKEFLSKCDILVASLPSTPATQFMLTKEHLELLPDGALFINVGRGDLVHSEDILSVLDAPGGLSGVGLDVTDPEPLPDGHPLFTHPLVTITPHTSGNFDGYYEAGADLLIANVERYRKEGEFYNIIDPKKGY